MNERNVILTKQSSLKEISLNTLPDIKNREYNRAKTPDFTAISAEHEKPLQNCPQEEKAPSVIMVSFTDSAQNSSNKCKNYY